MSIKFALGRAAAIVSKHAPEILAVCGVVGVGVGTVGVCKATLKAATVADHMEDEIERYEYAIARGDRDADNRELAKIYFRGYSKIAAVYAPSAALELFGIACLLGAYGIVKRRNVALVGAYTTLQTMFDSYRERVRDQYGEEADFKLLHGYEHDGETDDGEKTVVAVEGERRPGQYSAYARIFDEYNQNWQRDPQLNRFFLAQTQAWCNHVLKTRGHLFLNEVYDALGFDRTSAGAIVGWVLDGPDSDNVVDFGIFNILDDGSPADDAQKDFINVKVPSVLLDFNVDGVIYDLI